jgi:phosphoribosylformimino-5-aminoimidazole carboxamide ribotide isomerase
VHLKILSKIGAAGAIIGKALYTGDINLKQALKEINQ